MNCPKCGKELLNVNSKYICVDCGIEVPENKNELQPSEEVNKNQPTEQGLPETFPEPPKIADDNSPTNTTPAEESFSVNMVAPESATTKAEITPQTIQTEDSLPVTEVISSDQPTVAVPTQTGENMISQGAQPEPSIAQIASTNSENVGGGAASESNTNPLQPEAFSTNLSPEPVNLPVNQSGLENAIDVSSQREPIDPFDALDKPAVFESPMPQTQPQSENISVNPSLGASQSAAPVSQVGAIPSEASLPPVSQELPINPGSGMVQGSMNDNNQGNSNVPAELNTPNQNPPEENTGKLKLILIIGIALAFFLIIIGVAIFFLLK